MVNALDCISNEDVHAGSNPVKGSFLFNDDGGASRKARALKRVQSTKPEGAKRPSRGAGMCAANVGASF